ncbi:hypothetical protein IC607_01305 [Cellulomonas sp. JH27-2]|uniref:hypothetical protein n=1 Tax=Cellulomonas sp. JH27-2 TaxID=2774139 RepID=UPI001785D623|nr:hypothetical protein [Cellulomonas sp. JH27-2]MBD8057606.1 hypothetical protein [Cellulomonas sp. JH27-2]
MTGTTSTTTSTVTTGSTTSARRRPGIRSLVGAATVVAGVGWLVWLGAADHPGGPLADAWEQSASGGSLCLPAPQPGDATVALPINPSTRLTLSDVQLVGADGVRLGGASVVAGEAAAPAAGWTDAGTPASGATVGDHVGRTLLLHLVVDAQATPRYDDVRISYRSSGFHYTTDVGTGLRAGAACP